MDSPRQTILREASTTGVLLVLAILFFSPNRAVRSSAVERRPSTPPQESAQGLVKRMVQNELKCENDDKTHWRFRKLDAKPARTETWDVIETPHGQIERLLAVDGHKLTQQEREADRVRMRKFLRSAAEQSKKRKSAGTDSDREQQLLSMLPDALLYQYAGKQGDLTTLTFKPNPHFRASTREADVFHHMTGKLVIDQKRMRLAQLSGELSSRVNFGGGFLGHLNKGGTFDVKQGNVADDHWDMTLLDTELTGKALFFKTISVREKVTESDYRRVSDSLTLQQAAAILGKDASRSANTSVGEQGGTESLASHSPQVFAR
jgi:hypothetical protein